MKHSFTKFFILITLVFLSACNGVPEDEITKDLNLEHSSLDLVPNVKVIYVNQTQQFIASGGQPPYTFSLSSGIGSLNSVGLYSALTVPGDAVIRVTDSAGAAKEALVTVRVRVELSPQTRKISVNDTFSFSVSGGRTPYVFSIESGASTVSATGVFTAAAVAETAIVKVTDSDGYTSSSTVVVGFGPIINPKTKSIPVGTTFQFTETSGTPPFTWEMVSGDGSISGTGLYTAISSAGEAVVRVSDVNGFSSDATVKVFKFNKVAGGIYHTCLLIGSSNEVKCMGLRIYGQLGDGTFLIGDNLSDMGDNLAPVLFPSGITASPIKIMTTNNASGCALFDDGQVRCWGYSAHGQNGSTTYETGGFNGTMENYIVPVPTEFSNPIIDLSSSSSAEYHICGVYLDGTAKCWGWNNYGQLGQNHATNLGGNTTTQSLYSAPVISGLGASVIAMSTGAYNSCALLSTKNAKCWGYNLYGASLSQNTNQYGDAAGEMTTLPLIDFADDVEEIAPGHYHVCARFTNGSVRCWGYNNQGQLGRGNTSNYGDEAGETAAALMPIDLGTDLIALKIVSGFHHSCALLKNINTNINQIKCWGSGSNGQLGQESTAHLGDNPGEMGDNLLAIFLGTGKTPTNVFAGNYNTCALLDSGELKCWGYNLYGQLGLGFGLTLKKGDNAGEMGDNLDPVNLGSAVTAIHDVRFSNNATCVLLTESSENKVKCFGGGFNGGLGIENTSYGDAPNERIKFAPKVDLGTTKEIKNVVSGNYQSCAHFTDNTAKCWGHHSAGVLGDNGASGAYPGISDTQLGTNLSYVIAGPGVSVTELRLGSEYFACGMINGTNFKCWGGGSYGKLGQDNGATYSYIPTTPIINVGAGRTVSKMAPGQYSTCVILDNGSVKCWGRNSEGQLGQGDILQRGATAGSMAALSTVNLGTGVTAKKMCTGSYHACVITNTDKVKCWGHNGDSQLGLGHIDNMGDGPGEMGDSLPFVNLGSGRTVKTLSCGERFTCAIMDNDKLKCWGQNNYGQLGLQNTNYRGDTSAEMGDSLPYVDLGVGRTVLDINLGFSHACAVLDDNSVKCWGQNLYGQLGVGHTNAVGDQIGEMGDNLLPLDLE